MDIPAREASVCGAEPTSTMTAEVVWDLPCGAASLWANITQGHLWNQLDVCVEHVTCPVESHQGSLPEITNTLHLASLSHLA